MRGAGRERERERAGGWEHREPEKVLTTSPPTVLRAAAFWESAQHLSGLTASRVLGAG